MTLLNQRQTLRFTVNTDKVGNRLDQYLALASDLLSRGAAKKLIDIGSVHMNGRRVRKCSLVVNNGDRIEIHIDGLSLTPYSLAADHIVYEDKYILVVQKPAGVDSQPTPSRYKGTLYAALSEYLKNPLRKDLRPTIGMVQRLDRDTSGLIVFSIHQAAHKELTRSFQERDVTKKYQAFVAGRMLEEKGEYRSLLAKRRATNIMKTVAKGGQEAITRFNLLAATDDLSFVEIEIPTGRSHQIRAHFSEAGHPLLGDVRYGGPNEIAGIAIDRQMLHARQLVLKHPKTGEALDFISELPYDMQRVKTHFFNGS